MTKALVFSLAIALAVAFPGGTTQAKDYSKYKSYPLNTTQPARVPFPYHLVLQAHLDLLGNVDDINYVLLNDSNQEVVRMNCSFVPEGENADWAMENALKTVMHCSPDGKHVGIDEGDQSDVGTVFLIDLTDPNHPRVRELGGPDLEQFFPAGLAAFHCGVTEDVGWIDNHHLSLAFHLSLIAANGDTKHYRTTAIATFDEGHLGLQLVLNN